MKTARTTEKKIVHIGAKRVELEVTPGGDVTVKVVARPMDNPELDTRESGRACIIAELRSRGYAVGDQNDRPGLYRAVPMTEGRGQIRHNFSMNTSRYGHQWVIADWNYADEPVTDPERLRVLVDLLPDHSGEPAVPRYYVLPDSEFKRLVGHIRKEYLAKHGGVRPVTPDSGHCNVLDMHLGRWADRWDLFGLSVEEQIPPEMVTLTHPSP